MGIRRAWDEFRSAAPGTRFLDHHERNSHRSLLWKLALVAGGIVLIAGGVLLLVLPGPGLLLIALGLALVASQSRRLSVALDRGEARVRRWRERRSQRV